MEDAATSNALNSRNDCQHRNTNKRLRQEWTEEESPEAKKLRESFFIEILDSDDEDKEKSDDNWNDVAAKTDHLEDFMKSFEQEISLPPPEPEIPQVPAGDHHNTAEHISAGSDELGFLFAASDDDLGLPPTSTSNTVTTETTSTTQTTATTEQKEKEKEKEEKEKISRFDGIMFGQMWEFEDEKSIISDEFAWAFDGRDNFAGVDDDLDGLVYSDWSSDNIWPV